MAPEMTMIPVPQGALSCCHFVLDLTSISLLSSHREVACRGYVMIISRPALFQWKFHEIRPASIKYWAWMAGWLSTLLHAKNVVPQVRMQEEADVLVEVQLVAIMAQKLRSASAMIAETTPVSVC